jgi:hypothetical protein
MAKDANTEHEEQACRNPHCEECRRKSDFELPTHPPKNTAHGNIMKLCIQCLTISVLLFQSAHASVIVDQEVVTYADTGYIGYILDYPGDYLAQTFTVHHTGRLVGIGLQVSLDAYPYSSDGPHCASRGQVTGPVCTSGLPAKTSCAASNDDPPNPLPPDPGLRGVHHRADRAHQPSSTSATKPAIDQPAAPAAHSCPSVLSVVKKRSPQPALTNISK